MMYSSVELVSLTMLARSLEDIACVPLYCLTMLDKCTTDCGVVKFFKLSLNDRPHEP